MKHRVNVWTLTVTLAMTIASVSLWSRIAPNYMQDLGASKTDIGLAYMLFMVAFRVPQVLGGRLADRVGRKRPVVAVPDCGGRAEIARPIRVIVGHVRVLKVKSFARREGAREAVLTRGYHGTPAPDSSQVRAIISSWQTGQYRASFGWLFRKHVSLGTW